MFQWMFLLLLRPRSTQIDLTNGMLACEAGGVSLLSGGGFYMFFFFVCCFGFLIGIPGTSLVLLVDWFG